jgi:hypothetical protein
MVQRVTTVIVAAVIVAVVVAVLVAVVVRRRGKEAFNIGAIFGKVKDIGMASMGMATGTASKAAPGLVPAAKYVPTFSGREWDGYDWTCPAGSVDTGRENSVACATGKYMSPLWRWNGKKWDWSCPSGTVDTAESEWEKKCEVGWGERMNIDGKWQCPAGTWDSGATWENSDYHGALKQCKRGGPYTTRNWNGKTWACPPGTKDSGRQWGGSNGANQCKWIGG